jgi:Arc-like DNA binding domain
LRLPADLKDRIVEAAKRNNRSANAEIVSALEGVFFDPESEKGQRRMKNTYLINELAKVLKQIEDSNN